MKTVHEEKLGSAKLRIVEGRQGGYQGAVIGAKGAGEVLHDDDLGRLKARLRNLAGIEHPNYFGMEGAISRFLHYFPGGFSDPQFIARERAYKERAAAKLHDALPLDAAREADAARAAAVKPAFSTNMLHPTEAARIGAVLQGPTGAAFVRGAARFADGDYGAGLTAMRKAIDPQGYATWPMVTYLPNFWDPERHMFLKPEVTRDFAERIGHRFSHEYVADFDPEVYLSLLDLVQTTERGIAKLEPKDRIDVQSFIWVVGKYREEDRSIDGSEVAVA